MSATDVALRRPSARTGWRGGGGYLPAVAVGLLFILLLQRQGVSVAESLRYVLYLHFVIALPGRLVWRWLREPARHSRTEQFPTHLEDWVCGAVTGYVIELLVYPVARWVGQPRMYVVVPLLLLMTLWVRELRRDRRPPLCQLGALSSWGLAGVVAYLGIWMSVSLFRHVPVRGYWPSGEDEPFQLALVGELRHHFPPEYPYVEAGRLTYQWFVHAHMAASTWSTDVEILTVYRRFDVLMLSAVCVLGVAVVATALSRTPWAAPIGAGLLVLVGSFDITGATPGEATPEERFLIAGYLLNSPTQTFAFALMPPVVMLSLDLVKHGVGSRREITALLLGLAVVSGAKATVLPVALAGFLTAAAIAALRARRAHRASLVGVGACTSVLLLSAALLYAGDSQSLTIDPSMTIDFFMTRLGMGGSGAGVAGLVTLALLVMWLLPGAGAWGLLRDPSTRWDLRVWWLTGAVASGLGATFLLGHGGMSQLYFGRTVAPLVVILSAWGLTVLFPGRVPRRTTLAAWAVAVTAGLALLGLRAATENYRMVMPGVSGPVDLPVLRLWVNLPAVLVILVGFYALRLLVRDLWPWTPPKEPGQVGSRGPVFGSRYLVVFLLGLGLARSMAFLVGHHPPVDVRSAVAPIPAGGVESARWLRANSSPDDRVITNAHCLPAGSEALADRTDCDERHFWMSALTERRFVVEGWAYTRHGEGWNQPFWGDESLLAANDSIFSAPDPAGLRAFVDAHPADWLFADLQSAAPIRELEAAYGAPDRVAGRFAVFRID